MSRIRANTIVDSAATGAPTFPNGAIINGITTITADVSTTGNNLTIGTGTTISNPSDNEFRILTNGSERVRVNSSGKVGIGTDDPDERLEVGDGTVSGALKVSGQSSSVTSDGFTIDWESSTDSTRLFSEPQSSGSSQFKIYTTNSGTRSLAATINSSGNLVFPSGQGIDFSATSDGSGTMTSELLDDYEEGTFTPTLLGDSSNPDVTYDTTNTSGTYVKVGNLVSFTLEIRTTARTGGSGSIRIGGLPYGAASINSSEQEYEFPLMLYNVAFNTDYLYTAELVGSNGYIILRGHVSGGTDSNLQVSAWENTNPTLCRISGSYRVA